MLIPAPRTSREMLEMFRFYNGSEGLEAIFSRLDLAGVGPRQVYGSVLARLPEPANAAAGPGYDPKSHYQTALNSEEFQQKLLGRLLAAYPGKRRLLFVHVPKCAGSDLTANLAERYPSFNLRMTDRAWMPPAKLFLTLRRLVENLSFSETVFVHGHSPLSRYLAQGLVRYGDTVFAILRDPADMVMSRINYIITRLGRDRGLAALDTRDWMRFLNRATVDAAFASGDMRTLAAEILALPNLIPANTICTFLGNGDCASAIELCVQADVEVTDVSRYQGWLRERWGIASTSRKNASEKIVSLGDFGAAERQYIDQITAEDRAFYMQVRNRLDQSGALSIEGQGLCP